MPSTPPQQGNPNEVTLRAYNNNAEEYIRQTPPIYSGAQYSPLIHWIETSLSLLPANATIFEIGSGHGRDAKYFKSKGFNTTCSDAATAFVNYLQQNGHDAIHFNILKHFFIKQYDMVFANAVVPHFTAEDMGLMLRKSLAALRKNGFIAFNAKQGEGETWIKEKICLERFIHYWQPNDLIKVVEASGFKVIFFEENIAGGDNSDHRWIHLTAQKY